MFMNDKTSDKIKENMEKQILRKKEKLRQFLIIHKVTPNLSGFVYLTDAPFIYRFGMGITKELYPALAKKYKTPINGIDRTIRYAISHSDLPEFIGMRKPSEVIAWLYYNYVLHESDVD